MSSYPTHYPHQSSPAYDPRQEEDKYAYPYSPASRSLRRSRQRVIGNGPLAFLLVVILGFTAAFLILAAALGLGFAYFQVSGRIVPGITAGEAQLGGKSLTQAAVEVERVWSIERRIWLEGSPQPLEVPPAALGLVVDPAATAQQAFAVAHNQTLPVEISQLVHALRYGWGIAPVVHFDADRARANLQTIAALTAIPAQDATLRLEGTVLVAEPGKPGSALDIEATLAQLAANPQLALVAGQIPVIFQPVAPRVGDVSAALQEAQRLLNSPVRISAYDPIRDERLDWNVKPEDVASWMVIASGEAGPQVSLDASKVGAYLSGLNNSLGDERFLEPERYAQPLVDALRQGTSLSLLLRHQPTRYTVVAGDTLLKVGWKVEMPYWRILKANPGINPDALVAGQELVIPSKDDLLPLPVVENKRIVISISKQRLWAYQDGQLLDEYVISTGIARSPTQPGVFQIQTHEKNAYASVWDLHMPHFLGIYEAWPGFMNGIHGLPTLSNGRRLWANILGSPASYGCIILDLDDGETIYNWAENGVVVEIKP